MLTHAVNIFALCETCHPHPPAFIFLIKNIWNYLQEGKCYGDKGVCETTESPFPSQLNHAFWLAGGECGWGCAPESIYAHRASLGWKFCHVALIGDEAASITWAMGTPSEWDIHTKWRHSLLILQGFCFQWVFFCFWLFLILLCVNCLEMVF